MIRDLPDYASVHYLYLKEPAYETVFVLVAVLALAGVAAGANH